MCTKQGVNVQFVFNRIKPGYCPENDVRLGKDELLGAVCSVNCMHDYDCKNKRLCVSFNNFIWFRFGVQNILNKSIQVSEWLQWKSMCESGA